MLITHHHHHHDCDIAEKKFKSKKFFHIFRKEISKRAIKQTIYFIHFFFISIVSCLLIFLFIGKQFFNNFFFIIDCYFYGIYIYFRPIKSFSSYQIHYIESLVLTGLVSFFKEIKCGKFFNLISLLSYLLNIKYI